MKKIVLLFLLFLGQGLCFGQTVPPQAPNQFVNGLEEGKWVLWLDENFQTTNDLPLVEYYLVVNYKKGIPIGKNITYYKSGNIRSENVMNNQLQLNGKMIAYYENGIIQYKTFFENGIRQGLYESFYPSGKKESSINYKDNEYHGECITYYENGNFKYRNTYKNGMLDGVWEAYYEAGKIKISTTYKNGIKDGRHISYYENGKIETEGYYKDNEEVGKWITYSINGAVKEVFDFNAITTLEEWSAILRKVTQSTNKGNYQEALAYSIELDEYTEKNYTKEHKNYITAKGVLASTHKTVGNFEKAKEIFLYILPIIEKKNDKNDDEFLSSSIALASIYEELAQYKKAEQEYLGIIKYIEKHFDNTNPYYSVVLNNLSGLYKTIGDYDKSILFFEKIFEIIDLDTTASNIKIAKYKNNLGALYSSMDRLDLALTMYQEALGLLEYNKDHPDYGMILSNLGGLYQKKGEYELALSLYEDAVKNAEASLGRNNPDFSVRLNNLGNLYMNLGQTEKAYYCFLEVCKISEGIYGREHPEYALALGNFAAFYAKRGAYDLALPLYKEALKIFEKSYGRNHSRYGWIVNNLSNVYLGMKEYDKALPLAEEAFEIVKNTFNRQYLDYNNRLINLGILYVKMGNHEKGLDYMEQAVENIKNFYGISNSEFSKMALNLFEAYEQMNNIDDSDLLIGDIVNSLRFQMSNIINSLSESEKENYIKGLVGDFYLLQSRIMANHSNSFIHLFNIELLNKNIILTSTINMRQTIENSNNPQALKIYDKWFFQKSLLAKQYTLPISERREDLKELETNTENLEKQLLKYSKDFGAISQIGKTTWQDVQQKLKPNEVAIEFSSFQYYNGKKWTDTTQYIALILRKNDPQPQLVKLCTQNELDELLTQSGKGVNQVSNLYRGISEVATGPDLAKIYDLVWKPLTQYLKEGETIYFAPSGTLNQIAFSAITTPDGKYLSDIYDLHQVSTTAKLLEETSTEKFTDIALFGGVNYDEDSKTIAQSVQNIAGKDDFVSRSLSEDLNRGGETWS